MNASEIRQLEEVSLNATPAARELVHDGWLLRLTGGATRRVNSVQPLYPGWLATCHKIEFCESVYARNGLPTIFKMTEAALPAELDEILDQRGYAIEGRTSVQTCRLRKIQLPATPAAFEAWESPTDDWARAKASIRNLKSDAMGIHFSIAAAIALPKQFL